MANTTTMFLIYIVYGGIILLFTINGTRLLLKDRSSRLSQITTSFFYITAFALSITLVYRTFEFLWDSLEFYVFGHTLVCTMNVFNLILLFITNLIILKGNKIITDKKKWIMIIIWAAICSPIFFIPNIYLGYRGDGTVVPRYDLPVTIYGISLICGWYILMMYVTIQNFKIFTDPVSRKKYIMFNIALVIFATVITGNFIQNYFHADIYRDIFTYLGIIVFPAGIMLYKSVKKEKGNVAEIVKGK